QIEKVFFRALTALMPSNSTFAMARATTIQAARDLYGSGGAVERAVTQAWDAVGVQPRVAPTAAMLPNPTMGSQTLCGGLRPSWTVGIRVSAGASNLRITDWSLELFDGAGKSVDKETLTPIDFTRFFNSCGPPSDRIAAQTDACAAVCVAFGSLGPTTGFGQ